jgi:hypothetical protein
LFYVTRLAQDGTFRHFDDADAGGERVDAAERNAVLANQPAMVFFSSEIFGRRQGYGNDLVFRPFHPCRRNAVMHRDISVRNSNPAAVYIDAGMNSESQGKNKR